MNFKASVTAFILIFALVLPALGAPRCLDVFADRAARIDKIQERERLLPRIEAGELTNIKWEVPEPRFFVGDYNGQPVIGKRLSRAGSHHYAGVANLTSFEFEMAINGGMYRSALDEALWLKELNEMGLGAKLYGIVSIKGDQYMVMERIDGYNTNRRYYPKVDIPESAVEEMRRQFQLLVSNGIIPRDLQFQVSYDFKRVVLVDPEFFERGSLSPRATDLFWQKFLLVLEEDFRIVR